MPIWKSVQISYSIHIKVIKKDTRKENKRETTNILICRNIKSRSLKNFEYRFLVKMSLKTNYLILNKLKRQYTSGKGHPPLIRNVAHGPFFNDLTDSILKHCTEIFFYWKLIHVSKKKIICLIQISIAFLLQLLSEYRWEYI